MHSYAEELDREVDESSSQRPPRAPRMYLRRDREGSNNDIDVLNRSPLFDSIKNGTAPPKPFTVNGRDYTHGYYLADGIYPVWDTLIKAFSSPTDELHTKFTRFQESARKEVEHTFGVIQGRFNILRLPGRAWKAKKYVPHLIHLYTIAQYDPRG
ncbi:uncharacterized protein [Rutidosis leptorrhynchoides]|uniref:uncharacterized protein n=1 Tax=Rutidosis leptorrhynchoides TaxID=125765 RepID=UPI003A99BCF6